MYDGRGEPRECCRECPLNRPDELKTPYMKTWVGKRPIFIVGEGPGEDEDEQTGTQFTGETGKLLRREWKRIFGFDMEECSTQNTVRCRPPNNRTPKRAEIKRCFPCLEQEIERLKPTIIVTVGGPATQTFGIKKGITSISGHIYEVTGKPYKAVIPIVHPSWVKRGGLRDLPLFRDSLQAIKDYLDGGHSIDLGEYEILEGWKDVRLALADLHTCAHFIFDIETNGLDVFMEDPRIKCMSFSIEPRKAFTIKTEGWTPKQQNFLIMSLKKLMENPEIKKSGQRLSFERKWLKHIWGIELKGVDWDTKIAAFEIDKLKPSGLKAQAWDLGMGGYERMLPDSVEKCEGPVLFTYCATDSDAENRLMIKQKMEMPEKMLRYFKKLAIPLMYEFSDMHLRGLRVDVPYLDQLNKLGEEFVEYLKNDLLNVPEVKEAARSNPHAPGMFNPNASRHVQWLFYGVLGVEVVKRTKEGEPSVDKEVLAHYAPEFPTVVDAIRDYRTTKKFHSTYIANQYEHIRSDGRIHPTWSQTTARSGRSASEDPNFQNWPHLPSRIKKFPEKYWPIFAPRRIIIPDEGCEFGDADFSQQELRVAAAVSRDRVMTDTFTLYERDDPRADIHNATARAIFGIPENVEVTKEQRRAAKVVNFGIIYGMTEYGLYKEFVEQGIDIPIEECRKFIKGYFKKYYGYGRWTREVIRFVKEHHYVETVTGRRRNFPPPEDLATDRDREDLYREAVNTPVQGPAYDLCAMAIVRFGRARKRYGLKSYVSNTIHDSTQFNMFRDEKDTVIELFTEIATNPPKWIGGFMGEIPLYVDWTFEPRWGAEKEE